VFQDPSAVERAQFGIKYVLGQTSGGIVDDYPVNDTLRYTQDFHNYYSYDDGTAELGYGINGIGAQLAYKFQVLQSDTLRAVQFFFTQLGLSVSSQLVKLAVWSGSSAPSGAPVYEEFNQTPNYTDSINGFYNYLTDPVYLAAGTYFFGWVQNSTTILNLGLDINTPADQSKKFINTTGNWVNSQLPGMWMIRPVFSSTPIDVGVPVKPEPETFSLFPVPARDIVNIRYQGHDTSVLRISMFDASGRMLMREQAFTESIDVSNFENGLYILQLTNITTGVITSARFIVSE
jgi:hypothetical protein